MIKFLFFIHAVHGSCLATEMFAIHSTVIFLVTLNQVSNVSVLFRSIHLVQHMSMWRDCLKHGHIFFFVWCSSHFGISKFWLSISNLRFISEDQFIILNFILESHNSELVAQKLEIQISNLIISCFESQNSGVVPR